ncbi:exocyst complex component EXO84A-like [Impatiens glandulifera]|uniref:exocyst complex component EXO84A-like n=1 Tax=Impatiens glandulifera TaxID=253017 RepID=UPI001FB0EE86|nr:exocyst complex component EXO84A-like [Impatiens glandulifera]
MEQLSSASASRFRFRDHGGLMADYGNEFDDNNSPHSSSSVSNGSAVDHDTELESMTGKGIKHLCTELLELKRVSEEEFHKSIFANYTAFVRIFKEADSMKNQLLQMKQHISTQEKLVEDLKNVYVKALLVGNPDTILSEDVSIDLTSSSTFEIHIQGILETLDTYLSEKQFDEALAVLEFEAEKIENMSLEGNSPSDLLTWYGTAITERKAMLVDELKLVAGDSRVCARELHKALVGLCRLGDYHLATHLLFKYYHSRIINGTVALQNVKPFGGLYVHKLARLVFSMIVQAAKSFQALFGENSSDAFEFTQWACGQTEYFAEYFIKYVKSISEISDGLTTVVEAVKCVLSYCSLLEFQRIKLQSSLIELIRPCLEEVMLVHIDHFKNVIGIFTSSDAWIVGRYQVSGILTESSHYSMVIAQKLEYCLLTSSGRKFVTLLETLIEDISPLLPLQLEAPILKGLMELVTEYVNLLENALPGKSIFSESQGPRIILAVSLAQQFSLVLNVATLVHILPSLIRCLVKSIDHLAFEVDNFVLHMQEASDQVRTRFVQQFVPRIFYESGTRLIPTIWIDGNEESGFMPSDVFQGLFSELRKLHKIADDNLVEREWLMELLRELMDAVINYISTSEEIWTTKENGSIDKCSQDFEQFILDMHFLVELARHGGYYSNNLMTASMSLVSRMESMIVSAGFELRSDGWAKNAALEALEKLIEIEEKGWILSDESTNQNSVEYKEDETILKEDDDEEETIHEYSQDESIVKKEIRKMEDYLWKDDDVLLEEEVDDD